MSRLRHSGGFSNKQDCRRRPARSPCRDWEPSSVGPQGHAYGYPGEEVWRAMRPAHGRLRFFLAARLPFLFNGR